MLLPRRLFFKPTALPVAGGVVPNALVFNGQPLVFNGVPLAKNS